MVSGCDMILNTPLISDWEYIRKRKQEIIDKPTQKNTHTHTHKPLSYSVREKVLVRIKNGTNLRIFNDAPTQLPRCGKMELLTCTRAPYKSAQILDGLKLIINKNENS